MAIRFETAAQSKYVRSDIFLSFWHVCHFGDNNINGHFSWLDISVLNARKFLLDPGDLIEIFDYKIEVKSDTF